MRSITLTELALSAIALILLIGLIHTW